MYRKLKVLEECEEIFDFPDLFTFANNQPLRIVGGIRAKTFSSENSERKVSANFYAVADSTTSLMGKITAIALGTLLIGTNALKALSLATADDNLLMARCVMFNSQFWSEHEKIDPYPKVPNVQLRLDIDYSIPPKFRNFSIIPLQFYKAAPEELRYLLQRGIIEPCSFVPGTSWVSPGLVIGKKDGKPRFCVDMSAANRAIRRQFTYKMPTLAEMQAAALGKKHFAKLDLSKAFHHIELHEESRHITTFKTPFGYFRYKRMPFGLNVAPEFFQCVIESIVEDISDVKVYIDDILIMAETKEELHQKLSQVRDKLKENNLVINEEKTETDKSSIDFLGFRLSGEGVTVTDDRIRALISMSPPKNYDTLRSFLGKINFLNSFIPRLAHISKPLWKAARKQKSFIWGEEQMESFNLVKEAIKSNCHRCHFDRNLKTFLITDASDVAVSAVLFQTEGKEGRETIKIVEYASRLLNETQRKYPQFQLEMLGIVTGVKHFRHYLRSTEEFTILTDLQTAESIINKMICGHKREMNRHDKWILELSEFNYKIKHIPGKLNIADSLSRLATVTTMNEDVDWFGDTGELEDEKNYWSKARKQEANSVCRICSVVCHVDKINFLSCSEVKEVADIDPEIQQIKAAVHKEAEFPSYWKSKGKYMFINDNDLLQYGSLIIVPAKLRLKAMMIAHRTHFGAESTTALLQEYVYWPGMHRDVDELVNNCEECKLIRPQNTEVPIKPVQMPNFEWEHVAIDCYEAPSIAAKVISVVDYLTRKLIVEPIPNLKAETAIGRLETIFKRIGYPSKIRADNGSPFQSQEFLEWIFQRAMLLEHSAPGHPRGNGAIERTMKGVNQVLRFCALTKKSNWQEIVADHVQLQNAKPSRATNVSADVALEGRRKNIGLPLAPNDSLKQCDMDKLREFEKAKKEKMRLYADKVNRARNSNAKIGDLVWMRRVQKSNKLESDFHEEKYVIQSRLGNQVEISGVQTGKTFTRHLSDCLKVPTNTREQRRNEIWQSIATFNSLVDKSLPGEEETDHQDESESTNLSSAIPQAEGSASQYDDITTEEMNRDPEYAKLCKSLNRPITEKNLPTNEIDGLPIALFPRDRQMAIDIGAEKEVEELITRQISVDTTERVKRAAAKKSEEKTKDLVKRKVAYVQFVRAL